MQKNIKSVCLRWFLSFEDKDKIIKYCNDLMHLFRKGEAPLIKVIKRSRLRKNIEDYEAIAGGVAGIVYYNQQGYGTIDVGDSYYL